MGLVTGFMKIFRSIIYSHYTVYCSFSRFGFCAGSELQDKNMCDHTKMCDSLWTPPSPSHTQVFFQLTYASTENLWEGRSRWNSLPHPVCGPICWCVANCCHSTSVHAVLVRTPQRGTTLGTTPEMACVAAPASTPTSRDVPCSSDTLCAISSFWSQTWVQAATKLSRPQD